MDDTNEVKDEVEVTEGEVVSSDVVSSDTPDTSAVTILESLESMIRENLQKIQKLGEEANQHKEMVDSVLLNDEIYKTHEEAAKAAAKVRNNTRVELMKRPDIANVANKLKEAKMEIKEIKESMDSYLQEYQRLSGSNEIEDANGIPLQIVSSAKLVRRRA